MDVQKVIRTVSVHTALTVFGNICWGGFVAGWAVMGGISWPVAIVLGLSAAYVIIALVNVYKKSEWPFKQNVEQVVKDAIEHAGYKNINIGQSSDLVFHYQIEVDSTRIGIFQRRGTESKFFVAADWEHDTLFNGWPNCERQSFICAIKDDLLKLKLDHKTGDSGFRIKAPIFCDRSRISSAEIHEKVDLIINTIQLMQMKWLLVSMRLDAKKAGGPQHPASYDSDSNEDFPIRTALLRAYEICEDTKLGADIREKLHTDLGLTSYLLKRLEETDATFHGKRPPSTVTRVIPRSKMEALYVVEGKSDFAEAVGNRTIYTDVYISQSDFEEFMKYIKRMSNESLFDH